jgi:hypothetical protein
MATLKDDNFGVGFCSYPTHALYHPTDEDLSVGDPRAAHEWGTRRENGITAMPGWSTNEVDHSDGWRYGHRG